jgi:hypothetical protein
MAQRGRKPGTTTGTTRTTAARTTTARSTAARGTAAKPAGTTTTRRRRRTSAAPDYTQETAKIIAAVLKNRGSKGATPELLQKVIEWTRAIREENEAYTELANRPRRRKAAFANDRLAKYELNKALLDGILAGDLTLDILEDGSMVFVHSASAGGNGSGSEVGGEAEG